MIEFCARDTVIGVIEQFSKNQTTKFTLDYFKNQVKIVGSNYIFNLFIFWKAHKTNDKYAPYGTAHDWNLE